MNQCHACGNPAQHFLNETGASSPIASAVEWKHTKIDCLRRFGIGCWRAPTAARRAHPAGFGLFRGSGTARRAGGPGGLPPLSRIGGRSGSRGMVNSLHEARTCKTAFQPATRKKGTYVHGQKFTFSNGLGVYGRVFHLHDRLHKGRDRTTSGNRQSSSGGRSGAQYANGTAPGTCGTKELLGERENRTDI